MGQGSDKNIKNERFRVAVDYLYKEKMVNSQGELAEKIGISESALSRIMNNKKFVSDETLRKMNESFGGIFDMSFFRAQSAALTIAAPTIKPSPQLADYGQYPDMSSVLNAALAAKDETIASLHRELHTKDDLIQSLHEQLATKNQLIAEQKARLVDYRKIIDSHNVIPDYPFPMGVADNQNQNKNRKNV